MADTTETHAKEADAAGDASRPEPESVAAGEQEKASKSKSSAKTDQKAQKKAERQAALLAAETQKLQLEEANDFAREFYGKRLYIPESDIPFVKIKELADNAPTGDESSKIVCVRARVHKIKAVSSGLCFVDLRQEEWVLQAKVQTDETKVSKAMVKFCKGLSLESVIDVYGAITEKVEDKKKEGDEATAEQQQVAAFLSHKKIEITVERVYIVSESVTKVPPILIQDAVRPFAEDDDTTTTVAGGKDGGPKVNQDTRLDNRVIDLRTPANLSIFRIQAGVCGLFREILEKQGFIEIHTPKMISAASEGGGNVFEISYFERKAYLAQSPQFYKQMAIAADFDRVYTIGSVFRAEDSNTHRHLTEFIGLDLEMSFKHDYMEVVNTITSMFFHLFRGLQQRYAEQIDQVNKQFPASKFEWCEPALIFDFPDAVKIMRENGIRAENVSDVEDLSTTEEKSLGKVIKQKYKTDFYVIKKYPLDVRPFYTMPDANDANYSNSYDMFMRGEEIMSGAQRIHDSELLIKRARECKKKVDLEKIQGYINAFKYGCPLHGGGGIGLERVTMLFLGLNNIRKASMFPRDPKRLEP